MESTTKRLEKTDILSNFLAKVGEEEAELIPIVTLLSVGRIFPT